MLYTKIQPQSFLDPEEEDLIVVVFFVVFFYHIMDMATILFNRRFSLKAILFNSAEPLNKLTISLRQRASCEIW